VLPQFKALACVGEDLTHRDGLKLVVAEKLVNDVLVRLLLSYRNRPEPTQLRCVSNGCDGCNVEGVDALLKAEFEKLPYPVVVDSVRSGCEGASWQVEGKPVEEVVNKEGSKTSRHAVAPRCRCCRGSKCVTPRAGFMWQ
jgi:hypothetical protein